LLKAFSLYMPASAAGLNMIEIHADPEDNLIQVNFIEP
jgi:hypothetical protein